MPLTDSDVATKATEEKAPPSHPFLVADLEHPWLGLESFREETRAYFFGRDVEIAEIHLRLRSHPLLVLYGRSGLGKTSILNAGLIPRLRAEGQRPALHRVDYENESALPLEQLFYLLFYPHEPIGTWHYIEGMNRATHWWNEISTSLPFDLPGDFASRLWLRLHYRDELPSITHLILDQFEEVFTLGAQRPDAERQARDGLAILLQGFIPDPILRLITEYDSFLDHFDTDSTPVRVVLALRDDYVYALNRWKRLLPALGQNNFELGALRGPAAFDAVFKPGELRCHYRGEVREENKAETGLPPIVDEETARRIVRFVAKRGEDTPIEEIEAVPPILSLLCRELNERRFTEPAGTAENPAEQITFSESDTDVETIIKSFYERCVTGRPEAVRVFIEEELVSYSGARLAQDEQSILSCFEKGWKIPGAADGRRAAGYGDSAKARTCLEDLVNQRLLTCLGGGSNPGYELIHDLLAVVVEKSRLTREALERLRAAQRRKQRVTAAVTRALAAFVVTLIATLGIVYYAFIQEHTKYYRDFAKRNGFPVGIMQISKSEAGRLPVSFRLVHKGIVRDGWKLHWKSAFRVEAVNGLLELTTNHGVFPYLWRGESESQSAQDYTPGEKGERLGLNTVCQWEFVSTRKNAKNEMIYERALDRAGRMVYGLIYSPPGSGSPSTRLARFVGPDGFPQLQRHSAAEYVEIHYNKAGWEERIMYRDGKNLAAAGPYGAYGRSMQHNESTGQVTCVLSLDELKNPVIDDAGNSGMQTKYDEKGYDIEDTSVGPDLKPRRLKDGYVICKNQYDRFGRLRRTTYHGAKGEPVLSKEKGYHGWEAEYDEHGNRTSLTYLGLDEKPTPIADGYATLKSTYDAHGNEIRRTFHDVNGEPFQFKEGYDGWEAKYDEQGNRTVVTYLGLDGKATPVAEGVVTLRFTYDTRGRVTRMRFYGVNGEPFQFNEDYCGYKLQYDEQGYQTVETYLGFDEKPTPIADGYATLRKSYDAEGKMTRVRFYGVNGEPVLSKENGYHGWEAEFDKHGNLTAVVTYLGLDGKPISLADGYAKMKSTYDARGKLVRQTFHGVNGEPVQHKDGYYGWEAKYDKQGKQTAETYIGLDGKPTSLADGYAILRLAYDTRGKMTGTSYHGVNGEPVLSKKKGYHGWKADYDEQGKQTAETYLGSDGKPISLADGYAKMKSTYNARGKLVRQTFHGVNGDPVLSNKKGYHGWKAEYDQQGNKTVETYLGLDGKPMPIAEGYATMKSTYDARRKLLVRQTFHGVNGEPIQHKDGYYGWKAEYDVNGNKTVMTYIDLDGKATPSTEGYATMKSTYDARGKEIRKTFHGVNGEPIQHKDGYYGWKAEYEGNKTVMTYIDLDGKATPSTEGYATMKSTYDARGNVIRQTFYGANGEPVLSKKDGHYGWEAEYDENGNKTIKAYLGKDGKPLVVPAH